MRLTRRGWVVAAAVVLAFAMAAAFGPRGLNAIVAPGVIALAAGVWQMFWFEPPGCSRELPARGERSSTVTVRLALRTDTPRSARVVDSTPGGLSAAGADQRVSLGAGGVEYDLTLHERGEHRVGPATVVARDVLGLVCRTVRYTEEDAILVHPRVHRLSGPRAAALASLHGGSGGDRQAIDGLRRYRRGDPLRDIHWKSSAKQPDGELVVREFATEAGSRTVEVAAEAAPGTDDAMADAAASVAVSLTEAGVAVGLTTPDGRVPPDHRSDREAILDHLARATAGSVPAETRVEADVHVQATTHGVGVTVGGVEHPFSTLAGVDPATLEAAT